jgi:cytochrome P450
MLMLPSYYDQLYVGSSVRRTNKYHWAVRGFGPTVASFSTVSHDLHRIRRGALAPFFSKASVAQLEPTVQAVIAKFVLRLKGLQGSGTPINLIDAYSALTNDVRTGEPL